MRDVRWIKILFAVSAMYDGVLGVVFVVRPLWVFRRFGVVPPNHIGYVQFPAALLIVFAAMFVVIAAAPVRHRALIPYGAGLKLSYCLVAGGHWMARGIPAMWKPFVLIDLGMLALFVIAHGTLAGVARHRGVHE